jgi:hypothetical protein
MICLGRRGDLTHVNFAPCRIRGRDPDVLRPPTAGHPPSTRVPSP